MHSEFPIILVVILLGLSGLLIGLLLALQSLKQKMATAQHKLEGDIDQLTRSRTQTQTTHAALAQQNRNLAVALEQQTQALTQAKQNLETALQPLQTQLAAQTLQIQTLTQTNVQQESELAQAEEAHLTLSEQLSDLTRLKVCLEGELYNRQQWGHSLEQEVLMLRQANATLEAEWQRVRDNAVLLQTKVDWLTQMQTQQEDALRQALATRDTLQHQVQDLSKAKGLLERDLQREMERNLTLELKLKAHQQTPQSDPQDVMQPDPISVANASSTTEPARGPVLPQFTPLPPVHRSLTQPLRH